MHYASWDIELATKVRVYATLAACNTWNPTKPLVLWCFLFWLLDTPNTANQQQSLSHSSASPLSNVLTPTSAVSGIYTEPTISASSAINVISVSSFVKDVRNDNGNGEPKVELYVWEFVAIGCGVLIFILFIVIVLLCVSIFINNFVAIIHQVIFPIQYRLLSYREKFKLELLLLIVLVSW